MKEKAVAELDPVLTKTGFTKAVEMIYEDMGTNMAKNLGVEQYGGNVQIAGTKKVGYAYWCTVNKDMYICKVQNSLNYIDAAYFEAFSNNALLGKLNNLVVYSSLLTGLTITKSNRIVTLNYDGLTSNLLSFVLPSDLRPNREIKFFVFRGVYPSAAGLPINGIQLRLKTDGTFELFRNSYNPGNGDASYYIDSLNLTYCI